MNLRKEWRGERGKAQHLIDHTLAVSMRRRIGRRRREAVEVEDVNKEEVVAQIHFDKVLYRILEHKGASLGHEVVHQN